MKSLLFLSLIVITHLLVLSKLVFGPYPELFVYPYLTNNGLIPYKQIFDQHFPGLMFFPINFNNLGMVDVITARIWAFTIVIAVQLLIFIIVKKITQSNLKALLANLLFLIWHPFFEGWVLWIDSFLPLLLLPAFYFTYQSLEKNNSRNLFLAGLFLGLALVFKQVIVPLIVLVIFLLYIYKRDLNKILIFLLGVIPAPSLMVFYFFILGAFKDFWFWTVTFNLTTFAEFGRKYPFPGGLTRLIVVYSPALLTPFMENRKLSFTLLTFILGSLAAVYARFDFVHLQPSLPFICIFTAELLVTLLRSKKFTSFKLRYIRFLIVGYLLVLLFWLPTFYKGHLSTQVLFFDTQIYLTSDRIEQLTTPIEEIFLFGPPLHLYQMSNTLPAGQIYVFQFPWFIMETEDKFLQVLKNNPPKLVLRDRTVEIEGRKIVDFAVDLDFYIDSNYETFEKIGNIEFMKKNAD